MKKLLCLALALMLALTMTCALAEGLVAEEGAKIEFCYWESSDTIHDTWENALFDNYEPIFKIVVDFIEQYTE
jgi:hypothetical protein